MKIKKLLAIGLAALLVLGAVPALLSAAAPAAAERQLKFGSDGKFKIMQLADIQDNQVLSDIVKAFVEKTILEEQPDLIVLTGDNIYGTSCGTPRNSEKAIRDVFDMLDPLGIPVAAVFGNHDDQSNRYSKEEQMAVYNEYKCNLAVDQDDTLLDENGEVVDLEGCGTYNVPIYSSDGSRVAFNVWCMDSGAYDQDVGGYDHVRENQLKWMKQTAAALSEQNGGEAVPSFVFQHIIVPNVYEALQEVPLGTRGSIIHLKKAYILPDSAAEGSELNEPPACSEVDGGEVQTALEIGGVLAMICGHDHANSFQVPYPNAENKEFDIINTQTCGIATYGLTELRGIRVFELDENAPDAFETRTITYVDSYSDDFTSRLKYKFMSFWTQFEFLFVKAWMSIQNFFGISKLVA